MTAVAATNVGDIVEDGYQIDDDEHDSMGDSLKTNQFVRNLVDSINSGDHSKAQVEFESFSQVN